MIGALPFSYLHVFAYSDRKGTEAATLGQRVPSRTIAERSAALRALSARKNLEFRRRMVGTTEEVLVLETPDRETGRLVALTGNYVEVIVDGPGSLMRTMVKVRLTAVEDERTLAVLA